MQLSIPAEGPASISSQQINNRFTHLSVEGPKGRTFYEETSSTKIMTLIENLGFILLGWSGAKIYYEVIYKIGENSFLNPLISSIFFIIFSFCKKSSLERKPVVFSIDVSTLARLVPMKRFVFPVSPLTQINIPLKAQVLYLSYNEKCRVFHEGTLCNRIKKSFKSLAFLYVGLVVGYTRDIDRVSELGEEEKQIRTLLAIATLFIAISIIFLTTSIERGFSRKLEGSYS